MHYDQTRDEAVNLLRMVLAMVGQHDVTPNPLTYAVYYEHLSGRNRALSAAFEAALALRPRLTDSVIADLYGEHVRPSVSDAAQRISGDMRRVMNSIVESAAHTGRTAGLFGQQLAGLSGALAADNTDALVQQVDAARQGTQQMQASVLNLQQQVSAGQREIERLRTDLQRTHELALLCPLSGVFNRRGFEERLQATLGKPPPEGTSHCLVMIDIDHFKRVNDSHGHVVGDRVIAGLGEVLRSVPPEPDMTVARYGGEEFAILLPATTLAKATQVAEIVRSRVRGMKLRNRQTQEVKLTLSVSAGVAAWRPGEELSEFVATADAALYRSKQNGRDRVTVS